MNAIARLREHPRAFWFVFWGELAERASFYGMKTILVLYLVNVFNPLYPGKFSDANAATIAQLFTAFCYLLPLVGGFIADRMIGKYRTIVWFSIPYILGHLILGSWVTIPGLILALTLLACGSGAIKPNTSTLMGMVYEKEGKSHLLTEAFSYFYAAINIGAAVTSLSLPVVRNHYGYATALMFPTILMAVALAVFASGKKYYPEEHIDRTEKAPEQKLAERTTLARLSGIFLLIAVFWFVYDQSSSTWIIFANNKMDLWLRPFNLYISADQVQGVNPVLIVALTPFFNWLWDFLKMKRGGRAVPATRKMMLGFFLVIACMGIMAVAGFLAISGPVSVWWLILATFVVTMSELCVSVVGLEFAYTQALPNTHSTVTAAFLLMVFVGDFSAGLFIKRFFATMNEGVFFLIQTILMAVVAVIFHFVAQHFERQDVLEEGPYKEASGLHPG